MNTRVYTFGGGATHQDPRTRDKTIVGGKGANLAEMAGIGLPVPPGFTITTEECFHYLQLGADFSPELRDAVAAALGPDRHVVLDADALTSFAGQAAALRDLIAAKAAEGRVVITPHEGEFQRLFSEQGTAAAEYPEIVIGLFLVGDHDSAQVVGAVVVEGFGNEHGGGLPTADGSVAGFVEECLGGGDAAGDALAANAAQADGAKRHQNGNDGDDHQHLHQGEGRARAIRDGRFELGFHLSASGGLLSGIRLG